MSYNFTKEITLISVHFFCFLGSTRVQSAHPVNHNRPVNNDGMIPVSTSVTSKNLCNDRCMYILPSFQYFANNFQTFKFDRDKKFMVCYRKVVAT